MNFNTEIAPPKWEFGYWGKNYENWYEERLARVNYPTIPPVEPTWTFMVRAGGPHRKGACRMASLYSPVARILPKKMFA